VLAGCMIVVNLDTVVPERHCLYKRVNQLLLMFLASDVPLAHLLQRENDSFSFYRL
jgi:hypothetical protein